MELLKKAWQYIGDNMDRFLDALQIHVLLSVIALVVAILICVPFGILCAKYQRISGVVMNTFNSLRVIPSLAVLILVMPFLGTGFTPALVALTILACPPILINTFLAFRGIDASILEAASAMGMDSRERLRKVEFPLALPLTIAGIRTAAVEVVASATLAAFIGGGGLGTFIINGLGMYNFSMLLVGAVPVALLAISSEVLFAGLERVFTRYQRD
ncbi:ABC transporter permease [Marinicrinis sediminis]|uniref:ABC transporter permease n=1 Tax=Marinicrinis sediminis TaxID=1652465 RepID=A0ABW5RBP3_9BACL